MSTNPNESPVPTGTRALSPSKLSALQCPHRYRELYVLGEQPKGAEASALALGSLVHEVAACYVRHLRDEKRQIDQMALAGYAQAAWEYRPHTVPEALYDDYNGAMRRLEEVIFEPETILDAELRLAFDASRNSVPWESDDAAYGGMIDVLGIDGHGDDATAWAWDWTMAAISGTFGQKKNLQLRMYGMLMFWAYGTPKVKITTRSLRTGATIEVDLDEYDHAETLARVEGEAARLGQLLEMDPRFNWPAIPCSECGICTLPCPEFDLAQLSDVPLRLEGPVAAADVLNRITLLEAKRKGLMAVLKSYVTFHGAVESQGMEADLRPIERHSYPVGAVVDVVKGASLDPWALLTVNRKKLATKAYKGVRLEVEALSTVKIGERFGIKAAGMADDEGEE